MVKNANGGKNSKKMGRKFTSASVDKKVRLALEEGEIYAYVTKMLGNGMFNATCTEGKERLVIMRNKFRGRGKRDNTVKVGSWVLIGEREFESCAKPKHDLLEVYTDTEIQKLKNSKDPIFDRLKNEHDLLGNRETDNDITFGTSAGIEDDDDEINQLLESVKDGSVNDGSGSKVNNTNNYKNISTTSNKVIMDDGDTIDVDDI
jgi:initiation factor 1A